MLCNTLELWVLQSFFWNKKKSHCISVHKSGIISKMHSIHLYWAPSVCLGNKTWIKQMKFPPQGAAWLHLIREGRSSSVTVSPRLYPFHHHHHLQARTLLSMSFIFLCLNENWHCADRLSLCLFSCSSFSVTCWRSTRGSQFRPNYR